LGMVRAFVLGLTLLLFPGSGEVHAHGDSLVLEQIPSGDPLRPWFRKRVMVFGIEVVATGTVADDKILHAAAVLAEYLDQDENSVADQPAVVFSMQEQRATLVMFRNASQLDNSSFWNSAEMESRWVQDCQADETNPVGEFDASLEETLHLVHTSGIARVHGDLSPEAGSPLANAMDAARGGYFANVPSSYPGNAWYHYDDTTCDYECQAVEYFYWGLTSLLGAQTPRCSEIEDEWELCTPALLAMQDPTLYGLLINASYGLPMSLPDGDYHGLANSICGNGTLEFPEECDAGSANEGSSSCCRKDCTVKPNGLASCDGDACTQDQCLGGICSTLSCRDGESCTICGGQCAGTPASCECVF
ncbi:MAG: hypothetical protein ABGY42_01545, partial [bacterium]